VSRVSSVCVTTRYGLHGPGIESRWGRYFPRLSRQALRSIQGPAAGVWPSPPTSPSAEVKESVQLCLYSPFGPSWPVQGWTLRLPLFYTTKNVKCTLVQALSLCTGRTAHRGSRCIAILFHDHSTRRGWGVNVTPRPLFTPGKDLVPIVQEAGWAQEPVWTSAENLVPTGIRSPDRPAHNQSLYRLRYPVHILHHKCI
jgi:hypothetical protein